MAAAGHPILFSSFLPLFLGGTHGASLTTRRIRRWFVLEGGFLKYYYAKDDHGINAQPKARRESARDPCDPLGPCRSSRCGSMTRRRPDPTARSRLSMAGGDPHVKLHGP